MATAETNVLETLQILAKTTKLHSRQAKTFIRATIQTVLTDSTYILRPIIHYKYPKFINTLFQAFVLPIAKK